MPAAYMYPYIPINERGKDYKPTYQDFEVIRENDLGIRLGDMFCRSRSDIPVFGGDAIKNVSFTQSFKGPSARKLQFLQPQFCFIEYMGIVSYYKLDRFSSNKNLLELIFNELIYDLKAYSKNKGY